MRKLCGEVTSGFGMKKMKISVRSWRLGVKGGILGTGSSMSKDLALECVRGPVSRVVGGSMWNMEK